MVGNGATDFMYDVNPAFPRTLFNFNIITKDQLDAWEQNNCMSYFNDVMPATGGAVCQKAWDDLSKMAEKLNWYDLYRKTYPGGIMGK